MKTGRNAPCPCGSGKKYKKCCLSKDEAEKRASDAAGIPDYDGGTPDEQPDDGVDIEKSKWWEKFWDDFHDAPVERRLEMAREIVETGEDFDGDVAFSLADGVVEDLRRVGKVDAAADFIDLIEERRPEEYEEEIMWMNYWRAQNAMLRAEGDLKKPLELLSRNAEKGIDQFFNVIYMAMYHGKEEELIPAMTAAWPQIESSPDIMPWGKDEFLEILAELIIGAYADATENPRGDSPELLEKLSPGIDKLDIERIGAIVAHRSGRETAVIFRAADDTPVENPFPSYEDIFCATLEFAYVLVRRLGWTRPRAELARSQIQEYLEKRIDKKKKQRKGKRPKESPIASLLYPNGNTVENLIGDLLQYMSPQPYRVAALILAMPPWMDFLCEKGVSGERLKADYAKKEVRRLPGVLDSFIYDPVMVGEVRSVTENIV
jgi:hypothetical protein